MTHRAGPSRPLWLSLIALTSVAFGCGTRVVVIRGGPTPAWVDRLPRHTGSLCAVGYSGPTLYAEDCDKNAADNACSHLSETISATIRTLTIDISDGTRGSFSRDVFVESSQSVSETVLQGSEIEAQWVDLHGQRGAPNGCYAMVCIDPDKPIDSLVEKLEEKKIPPKTVERVRANAEAAFDELEKEEERREAPPPAAEPPPPAAEPPPPAAEPPPPAAEPPPVAEPPPADPTDTPVE